MNLFRRRREQAVSFVAPGPSIPQPFASFRCYAGPCKPGFYTDFLGVRTRVTYVTGLQENSGAVFGYPVDGKAILFGPEEWAPCLWSVLEAKGRFTCAELGAGWAPWLVGTAAAARLRGITDIQLIGVEASAAHFNFMKQHFRDNALDPDRHFMFHGVVGVRDGKAHFPRLPDPRCDWGAQAVPPDSFTGGAFRDYRDLEFRELDEVACICIDTLLSPYDHVNLIHCDIQGAEADVLPGAMPTLSAKVRRVVVGTHSREIEGQLRHAFGRAGWSVEADHAGIDGVDGLQVWSNPGLRL
jgi:FkbM family methyltransferase